MAKSAPIYSWLNYLIMFVALGAFCSCASVQSPTGGPRDSISPRIVRETPKNPTANFSGNTVSIEFDELIKLNNEANEMSISPAPERFPDIKVRRQILDITFHDTLEKNTTYTINFGKAVGDVNENNRLKNYTYVFSTGNTIDSLTLSGTVSSTLAREKSDITVFILPLSQDSLFGKKKPGIFTTTDSAGNFTLRNLKENTYRVYALKEQGQGDRIYNSANEEIGFVSDAVQLNKNITGVNIQTFKEVPQALAVGDRKIENDGRISLILNRPAVSPVLKILSPANADGSKYTEFNATRDTAFMWVNDLTFDSLQVALLDQGSSIDTVTLRRNKKDTYSRNLMLTTNLTANRLRPGSDLILTASGPLTSIDPTKYVLLEDSIKVTGMEVAKVDGALRKIAIRFPWRDKRTYNLSIAEGAATDIYNTKSKPSSVKFTLDPIDNYGNIALKIALPDTSSYLAEIYRDQQSLQTVAIPKSGIINFKNFPTGRYRVRIIFDKNKNGKWDTGSVRERRQPEYVWNYEKELTIRANWDIEETITVPKRE
jgi:hypothetical protein